MHGFIGFIRETRGYPYPIFWTFVTEKCDALALTLPPKSLTLFMRPDTYLVSNPTP